MSPSPFAAVWSVLDRQVEARRFPGYAAVIRRGDHTEYHMGGRLAFDRADPMQPDTVFRIASLSKLLGGALALGLVEAGVFGLDDPVAEWLPELASPRVLAHPAAELNDTVPISRPIVVRDLLTFTFGLGFILDESPLARTVSTLGIMPGSKDPLPAPDDFMAHLDGLPLLCQPGERWLYHLGSEVLGVLVARATGRQLADVLVPCVVN